MKTSRLPLATSYALAVILEEEGEPGDQNDDENGYENAGDV